MQVGRAAAVVLAQKAGPHPLFVIGRDTRLSGPMLEAALTAGLTSGGAPRGDRRRHPDAGARLAGPAARRRRRRRHQRLAQPLRRQRHQVLLERRHQAERRGGGRDRGAHPAPRPAVAGRRRLRQRRAARGRRGGLRVGRRQAHPARPQRHEDRHRLRARRHAPGRAAGARGVRRAGQRALRPAGRHQHQRRLRQHAHRRAAGGRRRRRLRPRPRLRRRRRPRAGRRRRRRPGGRRLHHRHPRPAPEGPGQAPRRHRGDHGHDQPGIPSGDGARGHPGHRHARWATGT